MVVRLGGAGLRSALVVLLAGLLYVAGVVSASALVQVDRFAGADRYGTAVEISKRTFTNPPVERVFVATGQDYADAMAAGPVAGWLGSPILLLRKNEIPATVQTELQRLQPDEIVVVGGSAVVSDAVMAALDPFAGGGGVSRVSGADRYVTAAQVADTFFGTATTALLASGQWWPDALSGGPLGGVRGWPMLLATSWHEAGVPAPTLQALRDLGARQVVILGGTAVLPDSLRDEIIAAVPSIDSTGDFVRLSGPNRFGTSAAIASELGTPDTAYLATGWADGVPGTPAATLDGAPILLSRKTCLPPPTYLALQDLAVSRVVLLGGTAVLDSTAWTTECTGDYLWGM
jgi:putative cell wall-binding protein